MQCIVHKEMDASAGSAGFLLHHVQPPANSFLRGHVCSAAKVREGLVPLRNQTISECRYSLACILSHGSKRQWSRDEMRRDETHADVQHKGSCSPLPCILPMIVGREVVSDGPFSGRRVSLCDECRALGHFMSSERRPCCCWFCKLFHCRRATAGDGDGTRDGRGGQHGNARRKSAASKMGHPCIYPMQQVQRLWPGKCACRSIT